MCGACDNLKLILAWEDGFLRQMAKDEWIKLTYRNTKYFYNLIQGRRRKARICSVLASDGVLASSNSEIGSAFIAFFTKLMGQCSFIGIRQYTVKNGYTALRGHHDRVPWAKMVWSADIFSRHQVSLLLAVKNRWPMRSRLSAAALALCDAAMCSFGPDLFSSVAAAALRVWSS
ncbi:hypothetical protein Dimus_018970 [Dionaea muscipula]